MDLLPSRNSRLRTVLLKLCIILVLMVGGYIVYLYQSITLPSPETDDRQPLRIYGAPYAITVGLDVERIRLKQRLDHLGYRQTPTSPASPGEYQLGVEYLDLWLHHDPELQTDLQLPEPVSHRVRLVLENGRIARLLSQAITSDSPQASDGSQPEEHSTVWLESPVISGVVGHARIRREWVPLAQMPRQLLDAVLAIEDHRFYRHTGVDPIAVGRAIWENLWRGQIVQGGSTITQQLAKNLYFSSERTWLRKIREAFAAIVMERKYAKDTILEAYLNEIYFGQIGSLGIYGVGEAAHAYFGKPVEALSLPEAALLAGMIKAPNLYSPLKDLNQAKQRRDLVLRRLHENSIVSANALMTAKATPVQLTAIQERPPDAPYFVDYVLHDYETGSGAATPVGAKLFTTLDSEMQRTAEDAIKTGLARLEQKFRHLKRAGNPLQAALVTLDPKTGAVLAMVGGRDYRDSQFNRAVQAKRQAGSLFKPFIYLAAFEDSVVNKEGALTAASLIEDGPLSFQNAGAPGNSQTISAASPWTPQNYDRQFRGEVTVRTAIEQSLNIPAIRVAQRIGIGRISRTLHDIGITEPLPEDLSLALGTAEVSLLQITSAFAVLARGGEATSPTGIRMTAGTDGWTGWQPARRVVSAEAAYLVTSLLQGVVQHGTASTAKALGLVAPVAGKTGTTDDHRDAWFIGYTPDLVIGVWVGYDDGMSLKVSAAQAALPIWMEFAGRVLPGPSEEASGATFVQPSGVVVKKIDPRTSMLATSNCPETVEEVFIEGTEPSNYCDVHAGIWQRFRHALGF